MRQDKILYRVKYIEKHGKEWEINSATVIAGDDALDAVDKVRKARIGKEAFESDNKVTALKVVSIDAIANIDIE